MFHSFVILGGKEEIVGHGQIPCGTLFRPNGTHVRRGGNHGVTETRRLETGGFNRV